MRLRASRLVAAAGPLVLAAAAACGPAGPRAADGAAAEAAGAPAGIVTTERGPRGGRLVLVDEDGARRTDVTPVEAVPVIDVNPTWSPDGRWVAFASSRGRSDPEGMSLWLVERRAGAEPVRLTEGVSVDRDPRFVGDGSAIVYASFSGTGTGTGRGTGTGTEAEGTTLDLWMLPFDTAAGRPAGPARRLTRTEDLDELSPWPWPDGRSIVYMAIERASQKASLWRLPLGVDGAPGEPRRLTDGPFDATPSVSPDGRTIAFAAPVKGRGDTDLFLVDADGRGRRVVVDDLVGDETGPVFSRDGRFLFATSVVRSDVDGRALLASLVFVDLAEEPRALRVLHDPIVAQDPLAVVPRLGVALGPGALDRARLRRAPILRQSVERIVTAVQERREQAEEKEKQGPEPGER